MADCFLNSFERLPGNNDHDGLRRRIFVNPRSHDDVLWTVSWSRAIWTGSLVVSEGIAAARFTPDPLPLAVAFSLIALAASLLARHYLAFSRLKPVCACKVFEAAPL